MAGTEVRKGSNAARAAIRKTTWFVGTAENKTFPNSKPLFERGTAHSEDYFDVVEHFSESTG